MLVKLGVNCGQFCCQDIMCFSEDMKSWFLVYEYGAYVLY